MIPNNELSSKMSAVPYWSLDDDKATIRRQFVARNFMAGENVTIND